MNFTKYIPVDTTDGSVRCVSIISPTNSSESRAFQLIEASEAMETTVSLIPQNHASSKATYEIERRLNESVSVHVKLDHYCSPLNICTSVPPAKVF